MWNVHKSLLGLGRRVIFDFMQPYVAAPLWLFVKYDWPPLELAKSWCALQIDPPP